MSTLRDQLERLRPLTHVPPRIWIYALAGVGLAAIAGYVNAVVLTIGAPPVTHITGSISSLGTDVTHPDAPHARHAARFGLVVAAFAVGAAVSGFVIGDQHLKLGRRYGVAAMIEGVLLGLASFAFPHSVLLGACLAATAAGVQNALASSFHGLIIRTTHMTGVVTDLGFLLGRYAAGHRPEWWRVVLLSGLVGGFVAGGVGGAFAAGAWAAASLLPVAAGVSLLGLVHYVARLVRAARGRGETTAADQNQ